MALIIIITAAVRFHVHVTMIFASRHATAEQRPVHDEQAPSNPLQNVHIDWDRCSATLRRDEKAEWPLFFVGRLGLRHVTLLLPK
jgi:hypothetical protein